MPLNPALGVIVMVGNAHMPESKYSQRRLHAVEKQKAALELRKAGATYDSIAQTVGYASRSGAALAVEAALRKTLQEPADELRVLDIERLNTMLRQVWPFIVAPTVRAVPAGHGEVTMQVWDEAKFHAINTALTILTRKAKLLGLDAPEKREVTGKDGGPVEIALLTLSQRLQRIVDAEGYSMSLPDDEKAPILTAPDGPKP